MEAPLTTNDHLDFGDRESQSPNPQRDLLGTSGELAESARPPTWTQGSGFSDDSMGLLSVGHLQSKDLNKILYDGLFISAAYMIVGTAWFMASSEWDFTTTVYFMVISVLTIGYGDVTVRKRTADRVIDSLLIVVGLAALGIWAAYAQRASHVNRLRTNTGADAVAEFDSKKSMKQDRMKLAVHLFWMVVIIIVGVVAFKYGEDTNFTTSFYWAVVTASTIGYGDVVPTTELMRWFTIFYAIIATLWMVDSLRLVGGFPFRIWAWQAQEKVFNQFAAPKTPEDRERVIALAQHAVAKNLGVQPEQPGCVKRSEFALSMLLLLDRISFKDYVEVTRVFDAMDADGEGVIRQHDSPLAVVGVEP